MSSVPSKRAADDLSMSSSQKRRTLCDAANLEAATSTTVISTTTPDATLQHPQESMAAYRTPSLTPPDGHSTVAQPLSKDEYPVKSPDKSPDEGPSMSADKPPDIRDTVLDTETDPFDDMFCDPVDDMFERMAEQEFIKWQKDRGVYERYKSTPVDPDRSRAFLHSYEFYASSVDEKTE